MILESSRGINPSFRTDYLSLLQELNNVDKRLLIPVISPNSKIEHIEYQGHIAIPAQASLPIPIKYGSRNPRRRASFQNEN